MYTPRFELSWLATAVSYALEKAANLGSPVVWSQTSDTVQLSNGQNVVMLANVEPAALNRLRQ